MDNVLQLMRARPDTRPYDWNEELERYVAYFSSKSESFWRSLGQHVRTDSLRLEASKVALETVRDYDERFGKAPSSELSFASHLTHRRDVDQKVSDRQRTDVLNMFSLLDEEDFHADDVRSQAAAVVRLRMYEHALEQVHGSLEKSEDDACRFARQFETIRIVGTDAAANADSIYWGEDVFSRIRAQRMAERITTGIPFVDEGLCGGPVRGSLTTFGASSGTGKSWALVQAAAVNLLRGLRVVYIDTELGALDAKCRIIGNLTSMGFDDVAAGSRVAEDRWNLLRENVSGSLALFYLPDGTRSSTLFDVIEEAKKSPGFDGGFDLLVVDYGDRLQGRPDDRGSYERYTTVWEDIRALAVSNNAWAYTASQLKDLGEKKTPTWEDLSGSRRKGERSDNVVLFWKDDMDVECRRYKIGKARKAPESEISEPILSDLAHCRITKPSQTYDHIFTQTA